MKSRVEKYIEFFFAGVTKSGATQIWNVLNKRTGENCGQIKWHGGFRKYCFFPTNNFLFDSDCLRMISEKMEDMNAMRREARRREKVIKK